MSIKHPPTRVRKSQYARQWDASVRTIDRWIEQGLFSSDDIVVVNGATFIREDAVPKRGKPKPRPPLQPHQQTPA
jgi:hypothetical protein